MDVKPQSAQVLQVMWRGMLMGLAEVVPGVSGGTVALITGIYARLIDALACFGFSSIAMLRMPKVFYVHHHLNFLIPLALGMLIGVIMFAQIVGYLLDHFAPAVWAFFFGVILTTVIVVGCNRAVKPLVLFGGIGFALSLVLVFSGKVLLEVHPLFFFLAGMVVVSAWILPAISGSYVLFLLGLYEPLLDALRGFEIVPVLALAGGCAVGLLLFVRILNWLLNNRYEPLLSLLTGFMLGSMANLWPWQLPSGARLERFVGPSEFAAVTGSPALVWAVLVSALLGGVCLWLIANRRV